MGQGVGHGLTHNDFREARKVVPARADNDQLASECVHDASDDLRQDHVEGAANLVPTVVVNRRVIAVAANLNVGLADQRFGLPHQVERAGDGQLVLRDQFGFAKPVDRRALPAERRANVSAQRRINDGLIVHQSRRLVSRRGSLHREPHELCAEHRLVAASAPDLDDAR